MAFRKFTTLALIGAACFAAAPASAKVYDFSFQGTLYTASGTFTTGAADTNADGGYDIMTLTGMLVSSDPKLLQGAFTLAGLNAKGASASQQLTSPDGQFYYNNIYVPGQLSFAGAGILADGAGTNGNFELNFYNGVNGGYAPCKGDCASLVPNQGNGLYDPGDIGTLIINGETTGVPEPATWAMLLLGFAATGWTLRSRRSALA